MTNETFKPAPPDRECGVPTEQDEWGCGEPCRRERGHDGPHACLCGEDYEPEPEPPP
jgi:hypothetical protein